MKTLKLAVLTVILSLSWYATVTAKQPFTVIIHDASQLARGVITFEVLTIGSDKNPGYAIDNTGSVVTNYDSFRDVKKFGLGYTAINSTGSALFLDYNFGIKSTVSANGGYEVDEHEFLAFENGELWYLIYDERPPNASEIAAGVPMTATFVSTIIQAQNDAGNTIFEWVDSEHLDVSQSLVNIANNRVDFCHGNSLALDFDNNVLLSCRNFGLIKIERSSGAVLWILAGNDNQFTGFTDIAYQHDFRPLLLERDTNTAERGIYGVFDDHESRGLVLEINQTSLVVTNTQVVTAGVETASFITGSFEQLPNGNFVICWGSNALWGATRDEPRLNDLAITEHNAAGDVLLEIHYPDPAFCYRARKFTPVQGTLFPMVWQ
ncbi:MAG: aryl-sulfate sulfotransferase [Anaerolineae bacterium]|nr:aryl-sulfate sulfotransferase [Anaerolineae bacterium]